MIIWRPKHPDAVPEMLGLIPVFLREDDPRPAREQFAERYYGGWSPFPGFEIEPGGRGLKYLDDPMMPLLWEAKLRDEVIRLYDCACVAIVQPDGSYEISHMD